MEEQRVFVTVGTTSFEELIRSVTEKRFLKVLINKGYTHLTLQIGRGNYEPPTPLEVNGIQLEFYRFKPSLHDDMKRASLVISHGGAGSITEALSLRKPLIVVVNETLMHNHQTELARKMAEQGYCLYTSHSELTAVLEEFRPDSCSVYRKGDPNIFGQFLDKIMGYSEKFD